MTGFQRMYRLYNPNSGEHFYTSKELERDKTVAAGWRYEGVGWYAPEFHGDPVYRLYSGTDHHYTMSTTERDDLIKAGWQYEGVGWYSDENHRVPVYRQFNPNVDPSAPRNNSGSHNYTTSKAENDRLVRAGWRAEGIGWYALDGGPGYKDSVASQSGSSSSRNSSSGTSQSGSSSSSKSNSGSGSTSSTTPQSGIVYYTASGKRYHQSRTCPAIVNRRVWSCTVAQAQAKGLTPCHDCF